MKFRQLYQRCQLKVRLGVEVSDILRKAEIVALDS